MRKKLTALVTAAVTLVAAGQQAEARNGRVAAGIAGGLAAGAILGTLAAQGGYYYGPYRYYAPIYDYNAPIYGYGPYYSGPPYVYEAPPGYATPRSGYTGHSHGGYYYGPVDNCWPCY